MKRLKVRDKLAVVLAGFARWLGRRTRFAPRRRRVTRPRLVPSIHLGKYTALHDVSPPA